jgi:transmembrane sensor
MRFRSRLRPLAVSAPAEEAARWLIRLEARKLSDGEQTQFEQWVEADPAHRDALEHAAGALDAVSRHAAAADIMAMRQGALGARQGARSAPWALVASVVGIGIASAALWMTLLGTPTSRRSAPIVDAKAQSVTDQSLTRLSHFATAIGERSTISLPDGSIATLDTQSALDVTYTDAERGIRLLRGQALFEVAKHKAIPFQVYAGGRRITALGTTFNVRLDGERLRVALIEGKLRVAVQRPSESSAAPTEQITMSPGEMLDTGPAVSMTVKVADATRTASWRDGVAVFVDTRLADVVAEMNRYTATPIVIADPSTRELRVGGVFKTGDPDRFAESVANVFPVAIEHAANGAVILRARLPKE